MLRAILKCVRTADGLHRGAPSMPAPATVRAELSTSSDGTSGTCSRYSARIVWVAAPRRSAAAAVDDSPHDGD
eukprot:10460045-Alexandrium_andersonii.AAC.1